MSMKVSSLQIMENTQTYVFTFGFVSDFLQLLFNFVIV